MTDRPETLPPEAMRLRAAHRQLDERPAPAVRAAILRAAAAHAHGEPVAQPVSVRAGSLRWLFRWRPGAAAGATVAVALLAVGLVVHVERQLPGEIPVEKRSGMSADLQKAAPVASPPVASPPAASPPASLALPAKKQLAPAAAVKAESTRSEGKPVSPDRASDERERFASPAAAGQDVAGAAEAAKAPATAPAAPALSRARMAPAQAPPAPAASSAAPTPLGRASAARESAAEEPASSPQNWLRRIVELRRTGLDQQADAELVKFRAAYPDVPVPEAALRK